jgi:RNA polymerase sporulation-specific sigma factor
LLLTSEEKDVMSRENMGLLHYVAQSFSNVNLPHDELVSIGSVGYTKALNTYDSEKGAKFSTYATNCIKNEILYFLRKEKKHMLNDISTNYALHTDNKGKDFLLEDTLSVDNGNYVEDYIMFKEDVNLLMEAIDELPEREQFIIKNRYGLLGGQPLTQYQLAKRLRMSQANISKIEQGIMKKLYKTLSGKVRLEENGYYRDLPEHVFLDEVIREDDYLLN